MKLNWRQVMLLDFLNDRAWHTDIKIPQVGVSTFDLSYEQGLIRIKRILVKERGGLQTYKQAVRISRLGKKAFNCAGPFPASRL